MDMDLAYRCQMFPEKTLNSRAFAVQALLNAGWSQAVIDDGIDAALAWAKTQRMTAKQEKYRKTRANKKNILKGDDALDAMFAAVGEDPSQIPVRKNFVEKTKRRAAGHTAALSEGENPMGLGLSTGGSAGDIKPYVNYDAKAGRMFRVDRSQQGDGTYATDKIEITNIVQFVADLANIRVGWVNYTTQGPIRRFVTLGKEPIPPRPEDKNAEGKPAFKQGFEIDLMLNKDAGGGAPRVFGSAAGCVIEAMDALHDLYSAAPEAKEGKLPIVRITGVNPVKSGQSTNYKPSFAITNWVDRPAALQVEAVQKTASPATAPTTGSTQVSAPAAAPQQAAMASANDFG